MSALRWTAFALGIAPAALGLGQAQPKSDLLIWGIAFGPDTKGFEAVVREFERRNPDIRVRVLNMGAGGMNPQKLMTSIVGNVPPDVIHQDRFTIGDWAVRGAFRPLDDLIERDQDRDPSCPRPEQYYPAVWREATYDGKVYAIPHQADNRALYWNKSLFRRKTGELRRAGLDPERPPRTWSEVLAYSRVLTELEGGTIRVAGFLPNFGNVWLYMYAFQNDASFMSDDGRRCTLYSPAAEEALRFMIEGYDVVGGYERAMAFQSGFLTKENDPFIVGKVALKIDGDWILNGLSRYGPELDFGVAPPPVPDDRFYGRGRFQGEKDRFISWCGGFSYAIPSGARNVEAAWRYIKWATSVEGRLTDARAQRDWEKRRGRKFTPKQSAHMQANEFIFNEFKPADPKFARALRTHIDLMPSSRIRPVTFVGQALWNEHVRALERACLKKLSPKDALLKGQAVVQRELDEVLNAERYAVVDLRLPGAAFVALLALTGGGAVWAYRRLRLRSLARHEARWGLALIAPWVVGFLVFVLGPMFASLFLSFTQYNVLSPARWVGGLNYANLFTYDQENVSKAFSNAFYLAGAGVPLSLATGLAVALLLNSAVRGIRFYRTFFYMPAIVPTVASAVLWVWLLTGDPNKGLINAAWGSTISAWFGTSPPGWLQAEAWAKPALVLMGVWGAGSGMILWLAGLKGVPTSLYEAASIDGASPKQQFWSVTLPQLSPIIFFNTVMGVIGSLQEFDRVYVMRTPEGNPGPADSLLVPVYHLFVNGFDYFKMGYASALAWVIFALILGLTLVQFLLAPRWVHYEARE
jgi:multiple sugar transport system permease protein